MSKYDILRECPICNIPIYWRAGTAKPEGVEYIKTKRHSVVLVHTNCVNREEKANEHKQSEKGN